MKSSDAAVENPVEMETEPVAEVAEPETKSTRKRKGPSPYLRCLVKKNGKCGGVILNKGTTVVVKRSLGERARSLSIVEVLGEEWQ
jgi:hypothetical protein